MGAIIFSSKPVIPVEKLDIIMEATGLVCILSRKVAPAHLIGSGQYWSLGHWASLISFTDTITKLQVKRQILSSHWLSYIRFANKPEPYSTADILCELASCSSKGFCLIFHEVQAHVWLDWQCLLKSTLIVKLSLLSGPIQTPGMNNEMERFCKNVSISFHKPGYIDCFIVLLMRFMLISRRPFPISGGLIYLHTAMLCSCCTLYESWWFLVYFNKILPTAGVNVMPVFVICKFLL